MASASAICDEALFPGGDIDFGAGALGILDNSRATGSAAAPLMVDPFDR